MSRRFPWVCRPGFTLTELLVAVSIIALLVGVTLPALSEARATAKQAVCGGNARQMALALAMYAEDNDREVFPHEEVLAAAAETRWWFGVEADASRFGLPEGERLLDRTRGRLWRYYRAPDSIEVCPSFPIDSPRYKPKYTTNWTTYGPPLPLMRLDDPVRLDDVEATTRTAAFVDAAQVNRFQAPASFANPLLEQWFYVTRLGNHVHYVHAERATASFLDGHVELLTHDAPPDRAIPGSPVGRPPAWVRLNP